MEAIKTNGDSDVRRPLIVGIAGALVVLSAILLTFFIDREPDRPLPPNSETTDPRDRLGNMPNAPSPSMGATTRTNARTDGSTKGRDTETRTSALGNIPSVTPSFDIVRINPDGNSVIAGRAPPNSVVKVMRDGKVIGNVTADKRGEWVLVPEKLFSSGTHELGVTAKLPKGSEVSSEQSVVVFVPERDDDASPQKSQTPPGSLAVMLPNSESVAPITLQKPNGLQKAKLSLDTIDYGQRGADLTLSGRAPPGDEVRTYLNNKYIGRAIADQKGIWQLKPDAEIPPGFYQLRIDHLGPEGKTVTRIEVPFKKTIPVADIPVGDVVLVQPGNSLWRLARRTYGSGLRYTDIYDANKDQIRDPNLIYPGQVFVLPGEK